jgi:hypothetical protein
VLGIVAGLVLGVAVVAAFVFLGSEGTIDAPRISGVDTGKPAPANTGRPAAAKPGPAPRAAASHAVPKVRVIGGAPPASGPPKLHFKRGHEVRFRVVTDAPIGFEIPGLGVDETVESDAVISFKAPRAGQFPVLVAASHIEIAGLLVSP